VSKLQLEGQHGILSLNGIAETGRGVQATSGVTGLGLPPIQTQWSEGAGNGATYRGARIRPRDIDIPIHILGADHDHLTALISEFAKTVTGGCTLRWIEESGVSWKTDVRLVGGGTYVFGKDTIGKRELNTVVTFRAGDPFWTGSSSEQLRVAQTVTADPFIANFLNLPLATSQTFGDVTMTNTGDADAYPVWSVRGPGDFEAIRSDGKSFKFADVLTTTETLVIDTKAATVLVYTDGNPTPANGYGSMDAAPKFWTVPPGTTIAEVLMDSSTTASTITAVWNPRKWVVI
jgi:hypothetical protein